MSVMVAGQGKGPPHPSIHCSYLVLDTMCLVLCRAELCYEAGTVFKEEEDLQLSHCGNRNFPLRLGCQESP